MAKTIFKVGAEIETLTKDELESALSARADADLRALLRGIKPLWLSVPVVGAAANTPVAVAGPEQGYYWDVRLISVSLTSGSSGQIMADQAGRKVAATVGSTSSTGDQVFTWSSHQFLLSPGEQIWLTFSNAPTQASVAVTEIPAERVGELLI